jgi:hypothetical protein
LPLDAQAAAAAAISTSSALEANRQTRSAGDFTGRYCNRAVTV